MSLSYHAASRNGVVGTPSENVHIFCLDDVALRLEKTFKITNAGINSAVVRHDGKLVATGGWDGRIRLFSATNFKPLAVLMHHKKPVSCLRYIQVQRGKGDYLLAASEDGTTSLWDVYT